MALACQESQTPRASLNLLSIYKFFNIRLVAAPILWLACVRAAWRDDCVRMPATDANMATPGSIDRSNDRARAVGFNQP